MGVRYSKNFHQKVVKMYVFSKNTGYWKILLYVQVKYLCFFVFYYYQTKEVKADFDKQTKVVKQLEAKTVDLENQLKVNFKLKFSSKCYLLLKQAK